MKNEYKPSAFQRQAWGYYGTDFVGKSSTYVNDTPSDYNAVGEVRYVVGWISDQMSRLGWTVLLDGKTDWTVALPDGGGTVNSKAAKGEDDTQATARASAQVLQAIDWTPEQVREVTTNLFVAGEMHYVAMKKVPKDEPTWRVISVIHPDRNEILDNQTQHAFRAVWSHPADPTRPDAPLFGVLPILEDIDWLSRVSRSQSADRISTRGIIGAADGLSVANGGDFWQEFKNSIKAKMKDPTDTSPIILRGATELVEPASSGRGMKGFSWVIPDFPFSDRLDAQMASLIKRLAFGLPIPPEIVFGLQAQSRATAFQVEENSYRAHIQPAANLVARVATKALQLLMPDQKIEVVPDPTDLLSRRNSVQDVKDAFDRGAVSFAYFRKVLGIPETAAATDADIELITKLKAAKQAPEDPANVAADEGVAASVRGPDDQPLSDEELKDLSDFLSNVDRTLLAELAGATAQVVDRAREKVGANARSREGLRAQIPQEVPNSKVAAELSLKTLKTNGVPVDSVIADSLDSLTQWWRTRAKQAQEMIQDYVGDQIKIDFTDEMIDKSVYALQIAMRDHIEATLEDESASALDAAESMRVISVAGGQ